MLHMSIETTYQKAYPCWRSKLYTMLPSYQKNRMRMSVWITKPSMQSPKVYTHCIQNESLCSQKSKDNLCKSHSFDPHNFNQYSSAAMASFRELPAWLIAILGNSLEPNHEFDISKSLKALGMYGIYRLEIERPSV